MPKSTSTAAAIDLLKTVPLFASCSKRELTLLGRIVEEKQFAAGEVVCREGESGLGLFILTEGQTQVEVAGEKRRQLGPGSFFGEIALLDGGPRTATVTATTPVRILMVPAWSFNATLKSQPELAIKMLKEVCRRVRSNDAQREG